MDHPAADYARLSLLIQRILDADVLGDTEGAALQREAEAARLSLEAGDLEAARQHAAQVALFTEALVRTHLLPPTEGRKVLETTRHLIREDTD